MEQLGLQAVSRSPQTQCELAAAHRIPAEEIADPNHVPEPSAQLRQLMQEHSHGNGMIATSSYEAHSIWAAAANTHQSQQQQGVVEVAGDAPGVTLDPTPRPVTNLAEGAKGDVPTHSSYGTSDAEQGLAQTATQNPQQAPLLATAVRVSTIVTTGGAAPPPPSVDNLPQQAA